VQTLIRSVTAFISRADGKLDGKMVFMMLNGLQGMSIDDEPVADLLRTITTLLERGENKGFQGFDDFHQLSGALSGLSRLNAKNLVVKNMFDIIARLVKSESSSNKVSKVIRREASLYRSNADRVGMALFGLQGFQKHPDIDIILNTIVPHIDVLQTLDGKALGMALQAFKSCPRELSIAQEQVKNCFVL
jgi:hypothetical protein